MINSSYTTVRIKENKKTYTEVLDTIAFNTVMKYISWQKFYDDKMGVDYYFCRDAEYGESYYLYDLSSANELIFQIVSDRDKLNYEFDTVVFPKELRDLLNDVKASLAPQKKTYGTYDFLNDYEDDYYGYKSSYKSYKLEKAETQLSKVEPMSNREFL